MNKGMKTLKLLLLTLLLIVQTDNVSAGNKNTVKKLDVNVVTDTIIGKSEYKSMMEELGQLRDSLVLLNEETFSKDEKIRSLQKSGVDDFLNIQDTTIFGSRFLVTSIDKVALRSKKFYSLIQDIHNLNQLLVEVENMKVGQFSTAGAQLTNVGELIDKINSYASIENGKVTDFLTEEQKQYYRDLVERYNKLVVQIKFN